MEKNIVEEINKQCSLRKIKVKDVQEPWITHEIIEIIHDKARLQTNAYKSKKQFDLNRSKVATNETKLMVKRARADFIKETLELHRNDAKTLLSKNEQQSINLFDHSNN